MNPSSPVGYIPLLYRDRPEWRDVTPIYNSAEENAVVRIATSEEFDDAFAYLRAVMNANELSERTLELTQTCIAQNPANYSVWLYRRAILRALNKDVSEELRYCEEVIIENPKNYQVWHNRKTLVDESGIYAAELPFIAQQLHDEPKNYHAWQHRQWVVQRFDLFNEQEMDFASVCLFADVFNNSAWNYRYFIGAQLSNVFTDKAFVDREVGYALDCIRKAPGNESVWSYLSGILINDSLGTDRPEIVRCCDELLARQPPCNSSHLFQFLIDKIGDKMRENAVANEQQLAEMAQKGGEYLDVLERIDPIRHNFWKYRRAQLQTLADSVKFNSSNSASAAASA
ncbi:hypothetical protein niasHT_023400 [Heterodera trifolii]|uniref:Protein farnesyltransferase/geranylgeranyltransferase type-1 subunit alpha n=1 Tax=Heterodera trifolii TaxID=157864 RepID=A0ABD2K4D4_9BILA